MKQAPTGRLPASAGVSDHHPSAGVGWRRGSRPATLPVSACLIRRQSRPFPAGRHAVVRTQRRPAAPGILPAQTGHPRSIASIDRSAPDLPAIAGIRPAHNRPLPAPTVLRRCLPASHLALVCRHQPASGRHSGGVPPAPTGTRPASGRHSGGVPPASRRLSQRMMRLSVFPFL